MKKLIILFPILLTLFTVVPCHAQAEEAISASYTHDIEFPTALTFSLNAESSQEISRIILRYRINMITTARVTNLVDLEFDRAEAVETSWTWDMRKYSLPPGAEVLYSWRIEDEAGNELETEWEVVRFDDDRHSWSGLADNNLTLYWYWGPPSFSGQLMETAQETLERLGSDTGAYLDQPVKIYVYASSKDLRSAMVYPQEWLGGIAFTQFGIVAIGVAPEDITWGKRVMTHELAHLVTYQMTFNPYSDIPTWLDEGISMYAEGELEPVFEALLDAAVSDDELISVQTLSSNFPADPDEARLSYAESYSLVNFLVDDYGREKMQSLLHIFKQGSGYDSALEEVYGFDMAELDDLWRVSLGLEPRQAPPVTDPVGATTPTPAAGEGLFSCNAASGQTNHSGTAIFGAVSLLLLPGIGEAIHLRFRRGKR